MPSWKMFSADDHVDLQYLPGDMWMKRVPQKYRDRVPRLIETKDGWHFEADGKIFGKHYKYDEFTSAKFGSPGGGDLRHLSFAWKTWIGMVSNAR